MTEVEGQRSVAFDNNVLRFLSHADVAVGRSGQADEEMKCPYTVALGWQPYDQGRRRRDATLAFLQRYGTGQKQLDTTFHILGDRRDPHTMCELQIPIARRDIKGPRTNLGRWHPVKVTQINAETRVRYLLMNRLIREATRKKRASVTGG